MQTNPEENGIIYKLEKRLEDMIDQIAEYGITGPGSTHPRCPQQAYYLAKLIGAMKYEQNESSRMDSITAFRLRSGRDVRHSTREYITPR